MQMLAWLSKTPKDSSVTNRERFGDVELPHVDDECLYLLDILEEIGTVNSSGMSMSRLSWTEIDTWARRTGFDLQPEEARALSVMSAAYAGQINATDDMCPVHDDHIRESIDLVNIQALIAMAHREAS